MDLFSETKYYLMLNHHEYLPIYFLENILNNVLKIFLNNYDFDKDFHDLIFFPLNFEYQYRKYFYLRNNFLLYFLGLIFSFYSTMISQQVQSKFFISFFVFTKFCVEIIIFEMNYLNIVCVCLLSSLYFC